MKFGLRTALLLIAAALGAAQVGFAQSNYQFRTPASEIDGFVLPAPAGPDGNFFIDDNWFDPALQNRFTPSYTFNERAFIENGGTAFVSSVGPVSPGQIAIASAGGTTGTLEVQSGGSIASRIGDSVNGNVNVGGSGVGTLRVLPGGSLTAEGTLIQGTSASNSITVGGLSGSTATLAANNAILTAQVRVFPNAAFSTTAGVTTTNNAVYTSEITGNGTNGKLNAGTTATVGGSLVLSFNGYTPSVGHNWNVVEAAAISGNFGSISSNANLAVNHSLVATKPSIAGGRFAYNVAVHEVLVLEVNRDTGMATLKHPGGSNIQLDGYFIGSDAGSLKPASWNSWDAGNHFGGDWLATDARPDNLAELKPAGDATINGGNSLNYQFGSIYDALAGPFGTVSEDLEFRYRRSSDGTQFPGKVVYTGTKFNTLLLQVDPTGAGDAFLRNTSDTTVQIDSYDVLSAAGRLSTAGWNSFDEQNFGGANTWLEVASNANQIGEVNQSGFTTLAPGASLNLGKLYTGGAQDLSLSFLLQGEENATPGHVLYQAFTNTPVLGDYNGNGVVDAADYTIWRDTLGSTTDLRANGDNTGASAGKIDAADYAYWKTRFGNTAGSGAGSIATAAVPEPAAWMLTLVGVVGYLAGRRRS